MSLSLKYHSADWHKNIKVRSWSRAPRVPLPPTSVAERESLEEVELQVVLTHSDIHPPHPPSLTDMHSQKTLWQKSTLTVCASVPCTVPCAAARVGSRHQSSFSVASRRARQQHAASLLGPRASSHPIPNFNSGTTVGRLLCSTDRSAGRANAH